MTTVGGRKRLTAAFVRSTTEVGKHGDGGRGSFGLTLVVKANRSGGLSRSWVQRLRKNSIPFDIGLGGFPSVSLRDARAAAAANAKLTSQGVDPRIVPSRVPTVIEALEPFVEKKRSESKNADKYENDIRRSFRLRVFPAIGKTPVDSVTSGQITSIINETVSTSPSTATKTRSWLNGLFEIAIVNGHCDRNPVSGIRAALNKGKAPQNRPALKHQDVKAAIKAIRESDAYDYTKLAFELLILTATRSGGPRGARWSEIDLESAAWIIPSARMKGKREHVVPLSTQAVAVLEQAKGLWPDSDLIFPTMSDLVQHDNHFSKLCKALNMGCVPHGFRSSFRDWCGEIAHADQQVAEASLAHAIGGKTETAYYRSDLFDRRRELMQSWSDYVTP